MVRKNLGSKANRRAILLTIFSSAVVLGSFVAKDNLLEKTSERLHSLQSAKTNLLLMQRVGQVNEQTLRVMERVQFPRNPNCAFDVNQVRTVSAGWGQFACLNVRFEHFG